MGVVIVGTRPLSADLMILALASISCILFLAFVSLKSFYAIAYRSTIKGKRQTRSNLSDSLNDLELVTLILEPLQ
jgi:hypothetical protein